LKSILQSSTNRPINKGTKNIFHFALVEHGVLIRLDLMQVAFRWHID